MTVIGTFSSSATYTRIGRQVSVRGVLSGSTSISLGAINIITDNLPFNGVAYSFGNAANDSGTTTIVISVSAARLISYGAIAATPNIYFSVTYTI